MKIMFTHRPAWAGCLLTLCALAAGPALGAELGPARRAVPSAAAETEARVIVKFKADSPLMRALSAGTSAAPPRHAQALSSRLGLALTDGRAIGARAQVVKASGLSSRELADRLAAQADVEYATVDGRMHTLAVPNDTLYAGGQTSATPAVGQWYLRAPTSSTIVDATSVVASINAPAAWDITTGSSSVVVAVIDTGVRFDHPDLAGKLLAGYDFIHDTTVSVDGDGVDADASDPGDYGCTAGETSTWHGTQTAGLIGAATNNGTGMAGVGWNVKVLPARALGKCGGFESDIQAAMLWVAGISTSPTTNANPARVISMSLGATAACSAGYQDVVNQVIAAGAVVVIAAGNEGLAVGTPANCAGVIAVAGVRHAGTKVGYSDLGPEVAISAPAGNCVNTSGACLFPLLTTANSGTTTPVPGAAGATYTGGGADKTLGTSFSTPLVAGTIGLMFSANPTLTPAQVLAALKATARAFPTTGSGVGVSACTAPTSVAQGSECYCTTSTCGAGLLDAGAATAAAAAIHASIGASATAVTAGATVTLDGSGSWPSGGASANLTYQWAITSGAASASLTSSTSSAATLRTNAAGTVVVSLTITDSAGKQASNNVTLSVAAPPPSGGDSGGGAMELGWLLGWLASVIGVRVVTPRRRGSR